MAMGGIDWQKVHQRLAASLSGTLEPGPEETRRILEARARQAARPCRMPDTSEQLELLAVSLAGESYGVETHHVLEVCSLKELTRLPCTPAHVAGVISLRGRILAILDLRSFFGLPARGLTELNRVVVLAGGGNELGLLVDAVQGIRRFGVGELQPGLPTVTSARECLLKGIAGSVLAVLDGRRLLADARLKVNHQATR